MLRLGFLSSRDAGVIGGYKMATEFKFIGVVLLMLGVIQGVYIGVTKEAHVSFLTAVKASVVNGIRYYIGVATLITLIFFFTPKVFADQISLYIGADKSMAPVAVRCIKVWDYTARVTSQGGIEYEFLTFMEGYITSGVGYGHMSCAFNQDARTWDSLYPYINFNLLKRFVFTVKREITLSERYQAWNYSVRCLLWETDDNRLKVSLKGTMVDMMERSLESSWNDKMLGIEARLYTLEF